MPKKPVMISIGWPENERINYRAQWSEKARRVNTKSRRRLRTLPWNVDGAAEPGASWRTNLMSGKVCIGEYRKTRLSLAWRGRGCIDAHLRPAQTMDGREEKRFRSTKLRWRMIWTVNSTNGSARKEPNCATGWKQPTKAWVANEKSAEAQVVSPICYGKRPWKPLLKKRWQLIAWLEMQRTDQVDTERRSCVAEPLCAERLKSRLENDRIVSHVVTFKISGWSPEMSTSSENTRARRGHVEDAFNGPNKRTMDAPSLYDAFVDWSSETFDCTERAEVRAAASTNLSCRSPSKTNEKRKGERERAEMPINSFN